MALIRYVSECEETAITVTLLQLPVFYEYLKIRVFHARECTRIFFTVLKICANKMDTASLTFIRARNHRIRFQKMKSTIPVDVSSEAHLTIPRNIVRLAFSNIHNGNAIAGDEII